MSDRVVETAKPREDFSTPAFHREGVAIQYRYATFFAEVEMHLFRRSIERIPGFVYWSVQPMTDGYLPRGIAYIRTRRGKVAIVFPYCHDEAQEDNTRTDRSVTIHYIGDVPVCDMLIVYGNVMRALEVPRTAAPPASPKEEEWEPCGKASAG